MTRSTLLVITLFYISTAFGQSYPKITFSGDPETKETIVMTTCSASISRYEDPLYVVDGIVAEGLRELDPESIERITILKNVSATAVYGCRGRFGVILITTKKVKQKEEEETVQVEKPKVYPNPTRGDIRVEGDITGYELFDSSGDLVLQNSATSSVHANFEISSFLSKSKSDIFFLRIGDEVIRIKKI